MRPNLSILFLIPTLSLSGSAIAPADVGSTPERCNLRIVDDLGHPVKESMSVCPTDRPADCEDFPVSSVNGEPHIEVDEYRIEGERHGPVTARISPEEDESCTVVLPRKAKFSIDVDAETARELVASFYRPDEDPEIVRPASRIPLDPPSILYLPSGSYLVSLARRGWAPDLHLLTAAPGSRHRLSYRQRAGWSAVIRTIAARDEQPVPDALVELRTVPGFDLPLADDVEGTHESRILAQQKSDATGLVAVSGLRVPLAGASVRHAQYLDAEIPAFSSETGTFRVFTRRLHQGGRLAIRVVTTDDHGKPMVTPEAHCGLFPPDASDLESLADQEALFELETDHLGVCRAAAVPAGRYALKASLPDEIDAYTVEPIVVSEGQITEDSITLEPIHVSGLVHRQGEGVPNYKVIFARAEDFENIGGVYPTGTPPTTDEDGEYRHVLWSAGRYMVVATNQTTVMAGHPRFVVIRGEESIDFEVSGVELEGQVVDESGEPRPEARVVIRQGGVTRGVLLGSDARFAVPFGPDWMGTAELLVKASGFHDAGPIQVEIEPNHSPDPVEVVLRRRSQRPGRIETTAGRPAHGAWISVHRLDPPLGYPRPMEVARADSDGRFVVPLAEKPLRLFYGGPGCPLGVFDLPPVSPNAGSAEGATNPPTFRIRCGEPSHLMLTIIADDPELRDRVPIILRRDGTAIPRVVLARHLESLGLPPTTDGQGRLGLVALEPGEYEIFHGKATSTLNVAAGLDPGLLSKVNLDPGVTIEIESGVGFR